MSPAFWPARMARRGDSENILVPRGMNVLAKTPSPLMPAVLISYIGDDGSYALDLSFGRFPFGLGGGGKRSVPMEIRP